MLGAEILAALQIEGESQRARRVGSGAEMTEPEDPTDGPS